MNAVSDRQILGIVVALGIGLLVGAERERRKGSGPQRRAAGLRTFAIVSVAGALSLSVGGPSLLAVAGLGVALLAAASHQRSRDTDPGFTTEAAVLSTFMLGALAVRAPAMAGGLGVVLTVLLASRGRLHHFVRAVVTQSELNDALLLAGLALVVLPLLPDRAIDPFGVLAPYAVGRLALVVMLIGAAGHLARRAIGPVLGLPLTGFMSGFVSSAATVGAMAALVKRQPKLLRPAASAAVLSTVATMIQMAVLLGVVSDVVLAAMAGPLLCGGLAAAIFGAGCVFTAMRRGGTGTPVGGRAFSPTGALAFAVAVSLVMLAAAALNRWLGQTGLVIGAGLAGFADTHSPGISVATLVANGVIDGGDAVLPILVALTTNAVTKSVLAVAGGPRPFWAVVVAGQAVVVAAIWLGRLLPVL